MIKKTFLSLPQSNNAKGFAMLFTVLIVSLILIIAIGISNVTFKQTMLSRLAKDSQIAFYQADAGVECGMYHDLTLGLFPRDVDLATYQFTCGDVLMDVDGNATGPNYFVFIPEVDGTKPCYSIIFDKTNPTYSRVLGIGSNLCQPSLRQVERSLEVRY